jgi:hypothetical protein
MRQAAHVAVLVVLVLATRCLAQPAATLETLRDKANISPDDRQQIRAWIDVAVKAMLTSADPDRRRMISIRDSILGEGRGPGRSQAFVQAFAEEAVAVMQEAEKKALSQEARVNALMIIAELRAPEGVPLLRAALEKDPYAASRYWAAKGLALAAPVIHERAMPRMEAEIADSAEKVLGTETSPVVLLHLFEALGTFDHERAHDVMAAGIGKVAMRLSASDPVVAQILARSVRSLEGAYAREVRPDAKKTILTAFATLCVWIMPPVADPNLMADVNASLEKMTGEKAGFVATDNDVMQKLALLEWVEKLVATKRIPKRPDMPPAVEAAVKDMAGTGGDAK